MDKKFHEENKNSDYCFVFTYRNGKTWKPSFCIFDTFLSAKTCALNFGKNRHGSGLKKISFEKQSHE